MPKAIVEAEQLLEDLGFDKVPVIPEKVCKAMSSQQYQITIEEKALSSEKFHGISMGNIFGATILVNSNIPNRHRKRFTAAHELAHVHLHIQTNRKSKFQCTAEDISLGDGNNDSFEKEANQFASALLMPASIISPIIHKNGLSWALVEKIRKLCDVSLEAAARRTIALSKESCCLIIHKQGTMWNPIKSDAFNIYLPTQNFPSFLYTDSDKNGSQPLPDNMEECDFSDWSFPDKACTGQLYYSSILNNEFDRRMTLLLHQEDACEDDMELDELNFS
ncbi:MAG: ImmA/IrrE family metallo-endopeptidase [Candidatus Poribacteria bacterium]|nr:ImmA/IrrE family metallo-endopeptidase [Candidatus Poribacteria bacterium]